MARVELTTPSSRRSGEDRPFTAGQFFLFAVIAGLVATVLTLLACKRAAPFYFEAAMESSDGGTSQLYFDNGEGIRESDSTSTRLHEGRSIVRFPLQPGRYYSLRFDPVDHGYCHIRIENLRIVDVSGRVVRQFSPDEFSVLHNISRPQTGDGRITFFLSAAEKDPTLTTLFGQPLVLESAAQNYRPFAVRTFLLCLLAAAAAAAAWFLFSRSGWQWKVLALGALGAFVFVAARQRFYAPISFDEGMFLWYGSLVNAGSVPYRDIFEPKGPVIFFANAIGLSLFGLKHFLFRMVPTAVAITSIVMLYVALIRRWTIHWLAALVTGQVALWLLGGDFHDTGLNDSETYGFAFAVMAFSLGSFASSVEHRSARIWLQVLSGVCFGWAGLTKELFIFTIVPAWLFLGIRRGESRLDWRGLLFSGAGAVATELLFVGYLLSNSAFGPYIEVLRFSRNFAAKYCMGIGRFPRGSLLSIVWDSWDRLHQQLYNLNHLAFIVVLCALVVPILWAAKRGPGATQSLVALAAVISGMVSVSVGYCFWKHYFLMGTTGLLLVMVVAADLVSTHLKANGGRVYGLACVSLIAAFGVMAWSPFLDLLAENYSPRVVTWDPLVTETIESHSVPGDYVLAPGAPVILVALDRRNPYPLGEPTDTMLPYIPALPPRLQMDSLRQQLEHNLPKVCYFPEWFRPQQRMWHQLLYGPLLSKYHYVKVDDRLWYLPENR